MTFSELMGAVVQTASRRVVAGSRRNALSALEARYQASRDTRDLLLGLTAAVASTTSPASTTARRSA